MSVIDESAIAARILKMFHLVHGNLPFTLRFVDEVAVVHNCSIHGECDFSRTPPAISIRSGLNEEELIEAICHELAHLVCGLDANHNEAWNQKRNELSVRYGAFCLSE